MTLWGNSIILLQFDYLFRLKKSHKNEIQTNNIPTLTILIPQYFTLKLPTSLQLELQNEFSNSKHGGKIKIEINHYKVKIFKSFFRQFKAQYTSLKDKRKTNPGYYLGNLKIHNLWTRAAIDARGKQFPLCLKSELKFLFSLSDLKEDKADSE